MPELAKQVWRLELDSPSPRKYGPRENQLYDVISWSHTHVAAHTSTHKQWMNILMLFESFSLQALSSLLLKHCSYKSDPSASWAGTFSISYYSKWYHLHRCPSQKCRGHIAPVLKQECVCQCSWGGSKISPQTSELGKVFLRAEG